MTTFALAQKLSPPPLHCQTNDSCLRLREKRYLWHFLMGVYCTPGQTCLWSSGALLNFRRNSQFWVLVKCPKSDHQSKLAQHPHGAFI